MNNPEDHPGSFEMTGRVEEAPRFTAEQLAEREQRFEEAKEHLKNLPVKAGKTGMPLSNGGEEWPDKIIPSELIPFDELLDRVAEFFLKFVVLSRVQVIALTLWVAHTHAFGTADTTPYLHITSPEKRSGKTRLLEVLELVVNRPWLTGHVTPAVLARKVDKDMPTLLLDESDAAFNSDKEYAETLRGILNTGHRQSGKSSVCTGQGANIGYKDLSTFCPKAIAGIGKLPDTVADRSIPIILKRRTASERIERFRRRKVVQPAQLLKDSLTAWVETLTLTGAEPDLPQELDDRAADSWEPLLAIADAVGGDWPEKARAAAIALSCGVWKEDQSMGIRLLADIKSVFEEKGADRLPSAGLVPALNAMEDAPWMDLDHKQLTANKMASLLKPYGVTPKNIRIGETVIKGYAKEWFTDIWNRYVPSLSGDQTATTATLNSNHSQPETATFSQNRQDVAVQVQSQVTIDVADVADARGDSARATVNLDQHDPFDAPEPEPVDGIKLEDVVKRWYRAGAPEDWQGPGTKNGCLDDLLRNPNCPKYIIDLAIKWYLENGGKEEVQDSE